ncbi:hypothetical protein [Paracraurococcus lichenis]|uniref:O-antigen ligase domain-containing protein n=1 Tax=Paracraurococcus lichenis TaxID=3064888 RepID=A0ABT9EAY0_9PROT|nr:hypothetical protein [Paracraurococcus sp. LOR1-02]MDO9713362.1 hypothetical protein [Paracraurococcus sp. LOR1-02]
MLVVAVTVAVTEVLSRVGLGPFGRLFYIGAGVAIAAYYVKRSPWLFLTATFWFWTITPLARRLIDYHAGFDAVNIVLATPNVMSLFMLRDILFRHELLRLRAALSGLFLLLPVLYGIAVSFVRGDIVPGAVAAADWVTPLLYYFYLLAQWQQIQKAEPHFRVFLTLNMIVVAGYGLSQYFGPAPWDAAWVRDAGMQMLGQPVPYGLRPFSTLNFPGHLAVWLATLLLFALHFRTKLMLVLSPAVGALLLLTLVRGALGILAVGICSAILFTRAGTLRTVVSAIVLVALVTSSLGTGMFLVFPEAANRVERRLNSMGHLDEDYSAQERAAIYSTLPAVVDDHPFGLGVGAIGRGATVSSKAAMVTVDSGPLAIYLTLGWIAGSIYLAGVLALVVQTVVAARSASSQDALVMAAVVVAHATGYAFSNIVGFDGAITWMCAGYANAVGVAARRDRALRLAEQSARQPRPATQPRILSSTA